LPGLEIVIKRWKIIWDCCQTACQPVGL